MEKKVNLYIHIPYCKAKCRFCSFFVIPGRQTKLPLYFKAIEQEILSYKKVLRNYSLSTIFFGGGTPSLVDGKFIAELLDFIRINLKVEEEAEITLEANPETMTQDKLEYYLKAGINRLSIGVQAWQNKILSYLGRLYKIEEFQEKYNLAKEVGFKNINLDLIFGIPGQSLNDWEESLLNIIKCDPTHISCYSLEVDEESIFGQLQKQGKFTEIAQESDREMYKIAKDKLSEAGFNHYEISNFAKSGYQCAHNSSLWYGHDYIGLGASAHSNFKKKRYHNSYSIERYISNIMKGETAKEEVEMLSTKDEILQFIIVQLRLIEGLDLKEFKKKFKKNILELYNNSIDKLLIQDLITFTQNKMKLTPKGLDMENTVTREFI